MGYHITILKTANGQPEPIPFDSFLKAAQELPALAIDPGAKTVTFNYDNQNTATLAWNDGEIWTKNPEEPVIAIMIALASKLGARVRGDELETYRTPTDTYTHPDDRAEVDADQKRSLQFRNRRKFWNLIRIIIMIGIAIMFAIKHMR